MDTECVFCKVGAEILYVMQIAGSEAVCCGLVPNLPLCCLQKNNYTKSNIEIKNLHNTLTLIFINGTMKSSLS